MRIIYLDEAGIGKLADDPCVVVAGIILHGDKQWLPLETYLRAMVEAWVPPADRPGIIFHAKDIFHGTKAFHRDKWEKETRFAILDELATLPAAFDFPVIWGAIDRTKMAEKHPKMTPAQCTEHAYLVATSMCLMQAERYMREAGSDGEVAQIVFEDRAGVRQDVKTLHRFLRGHNLPADLEDQKYLPLTRIIDTPNFAAKNESSPLQIADFCAFALKRKLSKAWLWDRFYNPLINQMVFHLKSEIPEIYSGGQQS